MQQPSTGVQDIFLLEHICVFILMVLVCILCIHEMFLSMVWFVWFYGISTFVGYLTPNPFLCK